MIKAIVFDCFGVLATDGWLPFRESHFSKNPLLLEKALTLNKKADAGVLHYDDFVKQVAQMARMSESATHGAIEGNIPNEALLEYIKSELKPHYKIGMLSNAPENWLDKMFTSEQVALFDATTLSYELGAIKPDLIMYQTIARRLGVEPSECIFIDDQPTYCEGAARAGMSVIQYVDFAQMKAELIHKLTTNRLIKSHDEYMNDAIEIAHRAKDNGGVAIGAVLVDSISGNIISTGGSMVAVTHDPTAHAEVMAIRRAAELLGTDDLFNFTLYSTLEPCHMCLSAAAWARIPRVYFGAYRKDVDETLFDIKGDFSDEEEGKRMNLRENVSMSVVGGVQEDACATLLASHYELPHHAQLAQL